MLNRNRKQMKSTNQPTNKQTKNLVVWTLKKKSLSNDNCVVSLMSNCVSWEGVWDVLELWGYLESRANRCLTLLERHWDAIPKGLWVPLGTKPLIVFTEKNPQADDHIYDTRSQEKDWGGGKKSKKQSRWGIEKKKERKKYKINAWKTYDWSPCPQFKSVC